MLKPDNVRNASVGDDSLITPPDHQGQDSDRIGRWTSDPAGRGKGQGLEGVQEFRSARKSGARHSIEFDLLSHDSSAAIGATASFRSAAMARHLVNKSRRNHLKKRKSVRESVLISELVEGSSESTPLQKREGSGGDAPPEYDTVEAIKSIILGKPVSVLLLLIPFAIWSKFAGWGAEYIFWLNFCVMIPLAAILGDFTEEAALHTNDTIGGLLNATFGNAVEVVVAVQALLANEIRVVQASMIGSIFSNLLLVLGCCFFFGGLYYKEQVFNSTAATANMGLLALSSIAMVLPTPFAEYYNVQDEHVLIISRVAALFLLFMYIQLLVFQLHTHKDIFDEGPQQKSKDSVDDDEEEEESAGEVEEEEEPSISFTVAMVGLAITTLSVTFFSDFLVGSIDEFCESSGISRTFVGLIILPIVGNAVEHITAVTVAMKNKMDLAMGGASIGSNRRSLSYYPNDDQCPTHPFFHFFFLIRFSRCRFLHSDFTLCGATDCTGGMGYGKAHDFELSTF
jgi:Ca2+:H+ antiporter